MLIRVCELIWVRKNLIKHLAFFKPDPISVPGLSCVSHISLIFEGLSVTTFNFQTHTVAFTPRLLSPHGHYRISNTVFCFLALGSSRCCWRSPNAPPLLIPVTSVPEPRSEFIYRGRDTGENCSGHPVNSRGITLRKHVGERTQITAHRTPAKRPRNHHKDSPQHQGSRVMVRITGTRHRLARFEMLWPCVLVICPSSSLFAWSSIKDEAHNK